MHAHGSSFAIPDLPHAAEKREHFVPPGAQGVQHEWSPERLRHEVAELDLLRPGVARRDQERRLTEEHAARDRGVDRGDEIPAGNRSHRRAGPHAVGRHVDELIGGNPAHAVDEADLPVKRDLRVSVAGLLARPGARREQQCAGAQHRGERTDGMAFHACSSQSLLRECRRTPAGPLRVFRCTSPVRAFTFAPRRDAQWCAVRPNGKERPMTACVIGFRASRPLRTRD